MHNDPYEVASEATIAPREYYGQITCEAYFCVLSKGIGREPFDANFHKPEDRRTAINLSIHILPEYKFDKPEILRQLVAESREWAGTVWPSAKKVGVSDLRALNGRWARVRLAPTGRSYTTAAGDTKEATTFQFVQLFDDETACRAAYLANGGANGSNSNNGGTTHPAPVPPPQPVDEREREAAYNFLKALVIQAQRDPQRLEQLLSMFPMVSRFYTIDSPEAQALLAQAVG